MRHRYKTYLSDNGSLRCNLPFHTIRVFIPTLIPLKNFRLHWLKSVTWVENMFYSSQVQILPGKKFESLPWGCWLDFIASEIYVAVSCHKQKTEAPFSNSQHCWHFQQTPGHWFRSYLFLTDSLMPWKSDLKVKIQPHVSAVNCAENRIWQQSHFHKLN